MEIDYKDKIKKLLALAQSPNENESRAALLKAHQLMAEHKLTEMELQDVKKQAVKDIRTDITCSKCRNPWVVKLSAVIGENYCCQGYRNYKRGSQVQHMGFVGLEDDVEICVMVFQYAVNCILSEMKQMKREYVCYDSRYVKKLCDSYAYGFVAGIQEAFQRQQREHGQRWGLALMMPKEVEEAVKHWKKQKFKTQSQEHISYEAYIEGYCEGKQFDPEKRLANSF